MFEGDRVCPGPHWNWVRVFCLSVLLSFSFFMLAPLHDVSSLISKWDDNPPMAPEHLHTPLFHTWEAQFPWEERASNWLSLDQLRPGHL